MQIYKYTILKKLKKHIIDITNHKINNSKEQLFELTPQL